MYGLGTACAPAIVKDKEIYCVEPFHRPEPRPAAGRSARLDLCDLYAFQSPADPSRTVLILNANPNADALHPDAIYRLAVDNDGDLLQRHRLQLRVLRAGGRTPDRRRLHGHRRGGRVARFRRREDLRRPSRCHSARPRTSPRRATTPSSPVHAATRSSSTSTASRTCSTPPAAATSPHRTSAADRRGPASTPTPRPTCSRSVIELPTDRTRRQPGHPDLGPVQPAPRRRADPRRPRRSSVGEQLLQHRRHQGGVQRQRTGQRSRPLARHVRPPDGAHRRLLPRRGRRGDRHGGHSAGHADASTRPSPRSTRTVGCSPTTSSTTGWRS